MNKTAAVLLVACSGWASAQNVVSMDMEGQPLPYVKEGVTQGCGLRILAAVPAAKGGYRMADLSANVWANGAAMVKGTTYDASPAAIQAGTRPKLAIVESVWIKAPGERATAPLSKVARGEDGFALRYATSVSSVIDVLFAQREGQALTVAIRRKGESNERIYSGPVKLEERDRKELAECLSEILPPLEKSLDAGQPEKGR